MPRRPILAGLLGVALPAAASAGILLAASSHEEYRFAAPPDRYYRVETSGAGWLEGETIVTPYPIGMISETPDGYLITGNAITNRLRSIDLDGDLIESMPSETPNFCCNADFAYSADGLYRAHYSRGIYRLNPATGDVLESWEIEDTVGMTDVNGQLWITKWSTGEVGTWDPATNQFAVRFTLDTRAGGLAFDASSGTLWVGRQFGWVEPYDLNGNRLGDGFQPFGAIAETIDGLAYVVPEPSTCVALTVLAAAAVGRRRR